LETSRPWVVLTLFFGGEHRKINLFSFPFVANMVVSIALPTKMVVTLRDLTNKKSPLIKCLLSQI